MRIFIDGVYKEVTGSERNDIMEEALGVGEFSPDEFPMSDNEVMVQYAGYIMSQIKDCDRLEYKEGFSRVQKFDPVRMVRFWEYEAVSKSLGVN